MPTTGHEKDLHPRSNACGRLQPLELGNPGFGSFGFGVLFGRSRPGGIFGARGGLRARSGGVFRGSRGFGASARSLFGTPCGFLGQAPGQSPRQKVTWADAR